MDEAILPPCDARQGRPRAVKLLGQSSKSRSKSLTAASAAKKKTTIKILINKLQRKKGWRPFLTGWGKRNLDRIK
jgi:hypothetical protein